MVGRITITGKSKVLRNNGAASVNAFRVSEKEHGAVAASMVLAQPKISYKTFFPDNYRDWFLLYQDKRKGEGEQRK